MRTTFRILLCVQAVLAVSWCSQVTAQDSKTARANIKPPEVFVRVELVLDELELIRFAMGRPKNRQPEIAVKDAAPREVYFRHSPCFAKLIG